MLPVWPCAVPSPSPAPLCPPLLPPCCSVSACDKGGQWEKAMGIFNAMEDVGLPRDAITYSALISALSKGRQWSLGESVCAFS